MNYWIVRVGLLIAGAVTGAATPIYYLGTGQTGAQTQIDVNHASTWTLTPSTAFDLGGGIFVMKEGSNTTVAVTLAVYQGANAAGTLLSQISLTNATFCGQVSNCGTFDPHQFLFAAPVPLTVGSTYFVALTSSAPDVQSQAYFIKADDSFISDANGTPITPSPIGGAGSPVPEPRHTFLVGGVLVLARLYRRR